MKNIAMCELEVIYHIVSEPGDLTRYDYFVYRDGPDDFCFMPARSTFRFPQRLNYYDVYSLTEHASDPKILEIAGKENCNPFTLLECIRTVIEFKKGNARA